MSGKGDCYASAAMESFWGTLKTERVNHEHYHASVFEYIEAFYNRQRLSSTVAFL
jgi:transposase InsO family protein